MLLKGKNTIIYGAGGIGSAVARAFAREGAHVHLAGRTPARLEQVAAELRAEGGTVDTAQVDALEESEVDTHADRVAAGFGSVDVSFNLISYDDVQGTPLAEMPLADFERPIHNAVRTMFLTTRAAARHMIRQRSGVILMFGGYGDPPRGYHIGGFQVALGALETLRRQLAAELGGYGIRVLALQTGGIAETIPADAGMDAIAAGIANATLLGRAATLADVGNVAAFAASDWAASMTATALNITAGTTVD
jgi:3-oxoacyl-[acyl-carrier protein] reductase